MKTIAYDIRSLLEGGVSGVAAYTKQLLLALLDQDNHLLSIKPFYNSYSKVDLPFLPRASLQQFTYPNKFLTASQFFLNYPEWDNLVEADVFFAPNLGLLPLKKEKPLVITAHDLSYERFPEFYSFRRRVWHKAVKPKELMQRADAVIAVSQSTKEDVVELYGVDEKKVHVVYSGVNLPSNESFSSEAMTKPYILYLGTLEPRKNVDSLVRAFSAIAQDISHDLVLAGATGWLTSELDSAIKEAPVRDRIKRLGAVSEEKKWQLLREADLFVYPSFYEGFGFPPLESLLAGTPVITSHNSALPEVAGEYVAQAGALINPYDVGELALVIKELLKNLPEVSKEAQAQIKEKYNWQKTAKETLKILNRVTG